MIQYQILHIYIRRIVWQTVRRITNEILGVKGLISSFIHNVWFKSDIDAGHTLGFSGFTDRWELERKTSRLLEARENASDKGAIDFSFESNRLKKLTQVFWIKKQATQSETKAKLVGLFLTVIWKFLCTLARRTAK